jgi:hypothetical protein
MNYFGKVSTDLVIKSSTVINEITTRDIVRRMLETFEIPSSFEPILSVLPNCKDSPKLRHWVSVSRCLLRSKMQIIDPEPRFVTHFYVDSLAPSRILEIHALRALEIVGENKISVSENFEWNDSGVMFPPTFNLWRVGTIHASVQEMGMRLKIDKGTLSIDANKSSIVLSNDGGKIQTSGGLTYSPALIAKSQLTDFVVPIDVSGLADAYHSNAPVVRGLEANREWIRTLDAAVCILHKQNPDVAIDCGRLCQAVLALHSGGTSFGSSSPQELMGLVFLPGVSDKYDLAECLLHESLHQKLYRVEEGAPLFKDGMDEEEKYYSPWRSDGRPLRMLVHGAYVFTGVSHYWRNNCEMATNKEERDNAIFHCFYRVRQAEVAISIVDKYDNRTEMGHRISEVIREGIDDVLSSLIVPPSIKSEANARLEQHESRFSRAIR